MKDGVGEVRERTPSMDGKQGNAGVETGGDGRLGRGGAARTVLKIGRRLCGRFLQA